MKRRWIAIVAVAVLSWSAAAGDFPGWTGLGVTRSPTGQRAPWLHVRHVTPGGPAEIAGIRGQDLIVRIDRKPVTFKTDREVLRYFSTLKPGQKVRFTVRRTDGEREFIVTAVEMPAKMRERWKLNQKLVESDSADPN